MVNEKNLELQFNFLTAITNESQKELFKHPEVVQYCQKRGMSDVLLETFKIGFIPQRFETNIENLFTYKAVLKHYPTAKFADIVDVLFGHNLIREIITKSGETKYIDSFSDRLLFPFFDTTIGKNVCGWTGRLIPEIEAKKKVEYTSSKYMNSTDTPLFNKQATFYNYALAKNLVSNKFCVLCEGQLDAIAFWKAGIPAVCASGTALSEKQIQLFKDMNIDTIILSFDNDSAGYKAQFERYPSLLSNFNLKFLDYKNLKQKDMDEIVNNPELDISKVQELVKSSTDEAQFLARYYTYTKTHIISNNPVTNKQEITVKDISSLTDLDKYEILFNTFKTFYTNHEYKITSKMHNSLIEALKITLNKLNLNITVNKEDENLKIKTMLQSFIDLNKQKPYKRFIQKKESKNFDKLDYAAFETPANIHTVLEILGKSMSRDKKYSSLWNNDSNPSLSVHRTRPVWNDFSSGRKGGLFELVGYLDLSDPDHPVVTDNPHQTIRPQAYNWLNKKLGYGLKEVSTSYSSSSFSFTEKEKARINDIEKYFKTYGETADKSLVIDPSIPQKIWLDAKQDLNKNFDKYFEEFKNKDFKYSPTLPHLINQNGKYTFERTNIDSFVISKIFGFPINQECNQNLDNLMQTACKDKLLNPTQIKAFLNDNKSKIKEILLNNIEYHLDLTSPIKTATEQAEFNKLFKSVNVPKDCRPIVVKVRHYNCVYPTYDVSYLALDKDNNRICLPESDFFVYNHVDNDEKKVNLIFNSKDNNKHVSSFLIPDKIKSSKLADLLKVDFNIVNIVNPTNEFIKMNFDKLSKSSKPIFVNNENLYTYVARNKIIDNITITKALANNKDILMFNDKTLTQITKSSGKHKNYYLAVYDNTVNKKKYYKNPTNYR